ncbi:hypothetical protein SPRG_06438 [Saprolegnia parasitica CBS 223.65]|uniref:Uncharacterized protein n=1 Tax=Saprolegnia parasitica (strain CBS 223.65) TaxID=695850 RepID=A0A067CP43_SAPPC|nr:hypothetical protein SPRG_06438 [Saprolegnia parasitica CBS 223.65]KDO28582.1 hypothetical protein SPRG_06438 [Saprolegnia parasitica CBS 223.65]|eukprot:XP_012200645.1 hypothetical protein SPRG_06438 [Saprolegnia parasitica CBS 223.65]
MAATSFRSVVLGQPEIASMVFEFQFGLYEDVRPAFDACNELLELDTKLNIAADPSFEQAFAPDAEWSDKTWSIHPLLHPSRVLNGQVPLHVAIVQGFVHLAKRILGCRPDLASDDAIHVAFQKNQLEIAELLLDQRESVHNQCGITHSHLPARRATSKNYWGNMLAREDSRGLLLLQRFDPRCESLTESRRRHAFRRAFQKAMLANAMLALDLFPWLHYPSLLDDMAGRGFLPLVRSLHDRGFECSTDAMDKAAATGHLEVVTFLHAHRNEGCTTKAMDDAATNGHLDVVQFLDCNRTEGCTVDALDGAISHGHLDVVRFLVEHRTEGASPNILDRAAANGHLHVVEYLHTLGTFDCTTDAVDKAAAGGHLDVVQFLLTYRSEGCTHDKVVGYALERCHLRTTEYLLSRGVGAWKIARFLLANEAMDVSVNALKKALRCGECEIAAQILQRQPELRHEKLLEAATAYGYTKAIRFLLDAGIGNPRECLVEIAGRPMHVTASKLLLPHCMDATKHLDNILYLLDLLALPNRRRKTTLQLITQELLDQGRKASETIQLAPSVAVRASTLLEAGEVVDWALALVIGHLHATDSAATIEQLEKKTALVQDAELKMQLQRLLQQKP